jgi:hypothetical protein
MSLLGIIWWSILLRYLVALLVGLLVGREGTFASRLRESAVATFWILVAFVIGWFVALFVVSFAFNVLPRSWVIVALWLALIGSILSWFAFAIELILAGIASGREA